jgi:hypothetical protein
MSSICVFLNRFHRVTNHYEWKVQSLIVMMSTNLIKNNVSQQINQPSEQDCVIFLARLDKTMFAYLWHCAEISHDNNPIQIIIDVIWLIIPERNLLDLSHKIVIMFNIFIATLLFLGCVHFQGNLCEGTEMLIEQAQKLEIFRERDCIGEAAFNLTETRHFNINEDDLYRSYTISGWSVKNLLLFFCKLNSNILFWQLEFDTLS